jgi:hypothetical protein
METTSTVTLSIRLGSMELTAAGLSRICTWFPFLELFRTEQFKPKLGDKGITSFFSTKKFDAVALKKYGLCRTMEICITMQQNFHRDAAKFLS